MKVMVGGTFDPLHVGHEKLLRRAFEIAGPDGHVIIGLTTDRFAARKSHRVRPYSIRKENLEKFITGEGVTALWEIEPLEDPYGSAITDSFDVLVVSEETMATAEEINRIRHENNLPKVDIYEISCVPAQDKRWISSTRIVRGEIDRFGRILR
ncbi:MAG: phosphopantetheine adenylyltransferase [Methanoculleaceae archaeon]